MKYKIGDKLKYLVFSDYMKEVKIGTIVTIKKFHDSPNFVDSHFKCKESGKWWVELKRFEKVKEEIVENYLLY